MAEVLPSDLVAMTNQWLQQKLVKKSLAVRQRSEQHFRTSKRWRAIAAKMRCSRLLLQDANAAKELRQHQAKERRMLVSTVRRIYGWARRQISQHAGSMGPADSVADCVRPLFAQIDADSSGQINAREFRLGLSAIGLQIDDKALKILMRHMDTDGDGTLDSEEFVHKMTDLLEGEAASGSAILSSFGNVLDSTGQAAEDVFAQLDEDGSGELDAAEWQRALEMLNIRVSPAAAAAAMEELDMDGGSTLEIAELLHKLSEFRRQRRVFAGKVLGDVCDYLKRTNTSVVSVFARVDLDGSGDLDMLELQEAMLRMGQDLSELEIQEIMRELALTGHGAEQMTSRQFLDALKQFETEREVYTAKCQHLFNEVDADGSGRLDRAEVQILAEKMGLADILEDPQVHLTLDGLIGDIENAKLSLGGATESSEVEEDDGEVTYDELLPWFLYVGRSYFPPLEYPTVHELEAPTEQQLRQLFDRIDTDASNEVNEQEAKEGILTLWPYLDTGLVSQAFEAADEDGSGLIDFHEFDELMRCLQFLNAQRHIISEVVEEFSSGVDEDSFWLGLTTFGIVVTDSQASRYFQSECSRLGTSELTTRQFLMWVCRYECIDKNMLDVEEKAADARAVEDLERHMTDFGDLFFDDLVHVVFTSHRGGYAKNQRVGELNALKGASAEVIERGNMLREAIKKAIGQHDSFPELPDEVIRKLVSAASSDIYYAGQNVTTQNLVEETFHIIRRGACEVFVDGQTVETLRAGDPVGEMALMYGTKRAMTVRTVSPCEVFTIDRAAYETAICCLPPENRQSALMKMMHLYWSLISGPDGSGRDEVDYRTYLKYHLRVGKTLMDAADEDEYDEDEEREIAMEDWDEDCSRYDLNRSGPLEMPMFFDSLYQMVDLWSGDLNVSYSGFLHLVFYNIAEWIPHDHPRNKHGCSHWKFKDLHAISGQGEHLEDIQTEAREKAEAAQKTQQEAAEKAEKLRVDGQNRAGKKELTLREEKERKAEQELEGCHAQVEDVESDIWRQTRAFAMNGEQAAQQRKQGSSGHGASRDGADADIVFSTHMNSASASVGGSAGHSTNESGRAQPSPCSGIAEANSNADVSLKGRNSSSMGQSIVIVSSRSSSTIGSRLKGRSSGNSRDATVNDIGQQDNIVSDITDTNAIGCGNTRENFLENGYGSDDCSTHVCKTASPSDAAMFKSHMYGHASDYPSSDYSNGSSDGAIGGGKRSLFGGREALELHTMPSVVCLHVPEGHSRRAFACATHCMDHDQLQAIKAKDQMESSVESLELCNTLEMLRRQARHAYREIALHKRKQKLDIDQRHFLAGERQRQRLHNNLSTMWERQPLDTQQQGLMPTERMASYVCPPLQLRKRNGTAAQTASPRSSNRVMAMPQLFSNRPTTANGLAADEATSTSAQTARPSASEILARASRHSRYI